MPSVWLLWQLCGPGYVTQQCYIAVGSPRCSIITSLLRWADFSEVSAKKRLFLRSERATRGSRFLMKQLPTSTARTSGWVEAAKIRTLSSTRPEGFYMEVTSAAAETMPG